MLYRRDYHNIVNKLYFSEKTNLLSFSRQVVYDSLPSNHLIICCPLLHPPSIFPSIRVFSNESVLRIGWPRYWSFSFTISPSKEHSGLISPCSPRDSQESSPTPQFKSINSLVLCLLYCPALTSIHDYWKDHSLDCMNLYKESHVFAF